MNRIARTFAPLVASVAASVACTAVSVALLLPASAQAQSSDQVKADFARAVYLHSATRVHNERPQPLLRAVVVLRVRLGEGDQWQAEVFRDNPEQPEMTRVALESVACLPAPVGLSPKARQVLSSEGVIEAWLFDSDGRFALKSLAKPQRSA